jgi:hypothetical protein
VTPIHRSPLAVFLLAGSISLACAPGRVATVAPSPGTGDPPAGRGRTTFTEAQLARGGPAIPLGSSWTAPAARVSSGSCWVRYEPVASTADAVFVGRNAPGWLPDDVQVAPYFGVVGYAKRTAQEPVGPVALSIDGLVHRARAFLRGNADLLGLVAQDFDRFAWSVRTDLSVPHLFVVSADLMDSVPPPPFPEIARRASMYVSIRGDGEIVELQTNFHPEIPICIRPGVTPEEAMSAEGILGRRFDPRSYYAVKREELGPATLTVDIQGPPDPPYVYVEYRLVYKIVYIPDGSAAFVVDAMTRRLLGFFNQPIVDTFPR